MADDILDRLTAVDARDDGDTVSATACTLANPIRARDDTRAIHKAWTASRVPPTGHAISLTRRV
jgi:hypothetical protein